MALPHIDDYGFGRITIDGERYNEDVIITPQGVVPNWWRQEGHRLRMDDLEAVLEADIDLLVIGQGAYSRMAVPDAVKDALRQAGIETIAQDSESACATYNRLREQRRAAAALHLTC